MTLKNATKVLRDAGLQSVIYNSSTDINMIIQQQSPQAYTKVSSGTTVELVADTTGMALIQLPNIIDSNMNYATAQLKELGIEYELSGDADGKVIKMEPEAGTLIEPGSKVKMIIKNSEEEIRTENVDNPESSNTNRNDQAPSTE